MNENEMSIDEIKRNTVRTKCNSVASIDNTKKKAMKGLVLIFFFSVFGAVMNYYPEYNVLLKSSKGKFFIIVCFLFGCVQIIGAIQEHWKQNELIEKGKLTSGIVLSHGKEEWSGSKWPKMIGYRYDILVDMPFGKRIIDYQTYEKVPVYCQNDVVDILHYNKWFWVVRKEK
ncbi:MAG: hypothetical protein K6G64_02385 [Eubacterium sp.]|nr:hypothetical protein [Eubacterium sp.]